MRSLDAVGAWPGGSRTWESIRSAVEGGRPVECWSGTDFLLLHV